MARVKELQLTMHDNQPASSGQIRFSEDQQLASKEFARYACLSVNTNVAAVVRLLLRGWRLKPPSVLISVTGSAQGMSIEPRLENIFIEGLSSAAFCTNAWVLTGGTNTGVMALAGRAVATRDGITGPNEHTPVIGFCSLSSLAQNRMFRPQDASRKNSHDQGPGRSCTRTDMSGGVSCASGKSSSSSRSRMKDDQFEPITYINRSRNSATSAALDPNHTHFVMVDDGTQGQFGAEVALRTDCEQLLRHELGVPGVQLVVQGGPNTLATVVASLMTNCPVLVVKESGGCAQ
eukprot:5072433-Prymnesium_polylepis.1